MKTIYIVKTRVRRGRGWSPWLHTVCATYELAKEYIRLNSGDPRWQADYVVAGYFASAEDMDADHSVRAARAEERLREAIR